MGFFPEINFRSFLSSSTWLYCLCLAWWEKWKWETSRPRKKTNIWIGRYSLINRPSRWQQVSSQTKFKKISTQASSAKHLICGWHSIHSVESLWCIKWWKMIFFLAFIIVTQKHKLWKRVRRREEQALARGFLYPLSYPSCGYHGAWAAMGYYCLALFHRILLCSVSWY